MYLQSTNRIPGKVTMMIQYTLVREIYLNCAFVKYNLSKLLLGWEPL